MSSLLSIHVLGKDEIFQVYMIPSMCTYDAKHIPLLLCYVGKVCLVCNLYRVRKLMFELKSQTIPFEELVAVMTS